MKDLNWVVLSIGMANRFHLMCQLAGSHFGYYAESSPTLNGVERWAGGVQSLINGCLQGGFGGGSYLPSISLDCLNPVD